MWTRVRRILCAAFGLHLLRRSKGERPFTSKTIDSEGSMKTNWRLKFIGMGILALALSLGAVRFSAFADDDEVTAFTAKLNGFKVVPPVLTTGTGTFTATQTGPTSVSFTLTFSGLTVAPTASQIHFAQSGVVGGTLVTLCGTPAPTGAVAVNATCPATTSGHVTAVIGPGNVGSIPGQNINAGNFAGFLRILNSGDAYVDVHTNPAFPNGGVEIRGQIKNDD